MLVRLQLKIALEHVKPAVWRRVVVSDSLTFAQLHAVIQAAMGWEDCHLHEFVVGEDRIGMDQDDPWDDGAEVLPAAKIKLADGLFGVKKFRYWYDFGDDWWHTISVEKILPADPGAPAALLVTGKNACPPEDCGGPWGYAEMRRVLADPQDPEFESTIEWCGDIAPAEFDLAARAIFVEHAVKPPAKKRKPPTK